MKALVAQELSGPSGWPTPTSKIDVGGDDAVIVDVGAAGVCFPDLLLICAASTSCGSSRRSSRAWRSPGWCVRRPTSRVSQPGQRVSALRCSAGGPSRWRCRRTIVVPTPDDIDDAAAVALLGNYYTMYFALARRGALRPGETVLVLGSAGGVGTAAIQIAKALGAKVIAMVHRPEAHGVRVESLGADVVLPLTDGWLRGGAGAHRRPRRGRGGRPGRWRGVRRRDPGAGHRGPAAGDRFRGRRHSDGQGQPAAAAQRQRRRRRLRRVRQPQARAPRRCSSSESANWSRPGCGRRRR